MADQPAAPDRPRLSMVVPVYESASTLVELHDRLLATLRGIGCSWEVVYVDDGSRDGSTEALAGLERTRQPALDRGEGRKRCLFARWHAHPV